MQSTAWQDQTNKVVLVYTAEKGEEKDLVGYIISQGENFVKIQTSTNIFLIPRNRIIHIRIKPQQKKEGGAEGEKT